MVPIPSPAVSEANSVRRTIPGSEWMANRCSPRVRSRSASIPAVEAVDEVVAGIDGPGLESELRIGPERSRTRESFHAASICERNLRGRCGRAGRGWPGRYSVRCCRRGRRRPGGRDSPGRWPPGGRALQPGAVLAHRHLPTLSRRMPPRCQPFDLQPERHGQRVVRAAHLQPAECHLLRAQEVVQDVVPSGREPAAGSRAGRVSANPCRAVGPVSAASALRCSGRAAFSVNRVPPGSETPGANPPIASRPGSQSSRCGRPHWWGECDRSACRSGW